ncbi:M4 family metallopeptidase [Aquimarina sp. 2201CG5-10]|uniref:M4 family metallopeptidase n=1 Tax=Aquimarina callyspongiae TaxID=3098150 RepID=UPI002AB4EDEE|nr:M4 family metallopeptidase [Aquimarina sp. 2201CG5-10]MDY8137120.1 M4 family metallopeptidase [Aquimarina sp. 2201CG5-10]
MKKITFSIVILAIALITTKTYAQSDNNGMKKLTFDYGLNEDNAISKFLSENKLSTDNTFKLIRSTKDRMGNIHNRYQQYYKGVKVEFGTLITHKQEGLVSSINGEIYDASGLNLNPSLNSKNSLQKAVNHLQITKASWLNTDTKTINEYSPEGQLVIIPNYNDGLKSVVLAYKFEIVAAQPNLKGNSYINANDGSSVLFNPIMKHFNRVLGKGSEKNNAAKTLNTNMFVPGTADTRYLGQQTIETRAESDGTYTLNDDANNVFTRDALNGSETTKPYFTNYGQFSDNDNNWTAAEHNNVDKDNAALDAHYGASKVKEYWSTIHNRNSYDDNGADLISYVHVGRNYNNAFWDGVAMSYGDGSSNPLTTFDICAHEIGHAITDTTADLVYANQSGGLNEGYSDLWGAAIQHYAYGTGTDTSPDIDVWAIGEDIGAIRSMSNPKAFGDPDTYLGTNWITTGDEGSCVPAGGPTGNDFCGVHTNSGVLNHWFYILVTGKTGTNDVGDNYSVTGIGMTKAEEIAYLTLRDYLTPNSTYLEARNASLTVTNNLYCFSSTEYQNVQNAWYAVNVGEEFVAVNDDVVLKSVSGNENVNCGTSFSPIVKIENGGANSFSSIDLSYTIDGGSPVNETITATLAACETSDYTINSIGALSRGIHTLNVTTTVTNDGRADNNTRSSVIIVNDNGTGNAVNSFETANDALIAYNEGDTSTALWERGVSSGTLLQDGTNNVYGTNLAGNHPDNTKAYLVSQCYDLSAMTAATLKFRMGFDLEENWDIIYMEYSTDGGSNWNVLGTSADSNWYNSNRTNATSGTANDCQNCPGAQWTGEGEDTNSGGSTNATLQEYSYELSDFVSGSASPASNIIFRFTFHSDASVNEEGVIIDDFVIEDNTLSVGENVFENFSYHPNPSNGTLQVSLNPKGLNNDISISLYDLSGRNVYAKTYDATARFSTTLDLQNLNTGMYLMDINQGDKNQYAKIIIK